jgi:hypothetical protein
MRDRFGVARCCCESFCEDCCNGNAPTEWDVEIQNTDDYCTTCNEDAAGVFTLARTGGICVWRFLREKESGWNPECVADYATYGNEFRRQSIVVDVRCINETQYRVRAVTILIANYDTGIEYNTVFGNPPTNWPPGYAVSTRNFTRRVDAIYETVVDFDDFTCNEQSAFEVPLSVAVMGWNLNFLYPYPFIGNQWAFSTGSATYTTLPIGPYSWGLWPYGSGGPAATIDIYPPCQIPDKLLLTAIP